MTKQDENKAALAKLVGSKVAKQLTERFADVGAAIDGGEAADLPEAVRAKLDAIRTLIHATTEGRLRRGIALSSYGQVVEYLRTRLVRLTRERVHVLYLDRKNCLIEDVVTEGTVDHAPVYTREIARKALLVEASAIIIAHNHPSGDPSPSMADVEMTKEIVAALRPLGIAVHDHFIIGSDDRTVSLRQLGLI